MAKRKDNEYTKIRIESENFFKDIAKKIKYRLQEGCKEGDGKPNEKKERGGKTKRG